MFHHYSNDHSCMSQRRRMKKPNTSWAFEPVFLTNIDLKPVLSELSTPKPYKSGDCKKRLKNPGDCDLKPRGFKRKMCVMKIKNANYLCMQFSSWFSLTHKCFLFVTIFNFFTDEASHTLVQLCIMGMRVRIVPNIP